jgi:N-acyl homoserine lactone hydrolase
MVLTDSSRPPTVDTLLQGFSVSSDQGSIGFCGVYLICAGSRRILFDCGHTGRRRALLSALTARRLRPADIHALVLSHAHWDHIQNADLFTTADLLVHPAEMDYLARRPVDDPVTPPWSVTIVEQLKISATCDGMEIAPGVTVTDLPGHTTGSIGLTVQTPDGTAILTGDAVSSARALRTGRCTAVHAGEEAASRSLQKVRSGARFVFPGHDLPFAVRAGVPAEYLMPRAVLRTEGTARGHALHRGDESHS